jgi:SAM-dependent methyltransferase
MIAYDRLGEGYGSRRRADPRIAARIWSALGDARTVLNVGAGTGSYEPTDRIVQALEPSRVMIGQRPEGAAPCLQGRAESLPFAKGAFEAAMAVLTIHHWEDWRAGLREMRRVSRGRVVLFTFDCASSDFWLTRDYFPELVALDRLAMPALGELASELGEFRLEAVAVPFDCQDGFLGAYWRRPEVYLDPLARRCMSAFAKIDAAQGLERLARDLENGSWRERNASILELEALDVGYRLLYWDSP